MTEPDFRALALARAGAVEKRHHGHADFRLSGRIFASLNSPDIGWAMVKLTPAQQAGVLEKASRAFRPANGSWGAQGYTLIFLADADAALTRETLDLAAANVTTTTKSRAPQSG